MGKSIEVSAKTIEEAIEKGLLELGGVERESVTVEVLETPKSGFLGIGGTPAKIKMTELFGAVTADGDASVAEEFLSEVLSLIGLSIELRATSDDEGNLKIELVGDGLGTVIGKRGETLDALQHITNLVANKKGSERVRISLDAENYREKREESLKKFAKRAAGQVTKYKRNKTLEPMNAYERHVIHLALQDMENIATSSVGADPNRRVVISYTGPDAAPPRSSGYSYRRR